MIAWNFEYLRIRIRIRVIKTRVAFYYLEIENEISILPNFYPYCIEGMKLKFNLKKYLIL